MPEQFEAMFERRTTKMKITQLSPNIGANIDGVDLTKPLPRSHGSIKAAWDQHLVLRFRNQSINDDDLLRFKNILGNLIRQVQTHTGLHFYRNIPKSTSSQTSGGRRDTNWKSRRWRGSLALRMSISSNPQWPASFTRLKYLDTRATHTSVI